MACRWRCTRPPACPRSSCTTATRVAPGSPGSRTRTPTAHVARDRELVAGVPVPGGLPVVRAVAEVRQLERVPRQGRGPEAALAARHRLTPGRSAVDAEHPTAVDLGRTPGPRASSTRTLTSAWRSAQSHRSSAPPFSAAAAAAAARAADGPSCRRERVGGRERGGVGRGVSARRPRRRRTRLAESDQHETGEHHEHEPEDRHAAALRAVHRSVRMVAAAWSSGSGNSRPTSGRSVRDV